MREMKGEIVTSNDQPARRAADSEEIDIETIMQEIRAEILTQKGAAATASGGKRQLSPELYEHLYQARLTHDQLLVKLLVTPVKVPLIGRLLERARQTFHELVLFYVNQAAAKQMRVNHHLLQAVNLLSQEIEKLPPKREAEKERDATERRS